MTDLAYEGVETPEISAVWEEFQKTRSIVAKNRLVMHYVYLVNRIVSRIMPTYNSYNSHDDLVGYGVLGLIDAVDKFIPDKNVSFEAYATKRIRGEIIDNIRRQDWAPVSLRGRIKDISRAYDELYLSTEGDVSDDMIAEKLGLEVEQVRSALEKAYMFNVVHFETLLQTADNETLRIQETLACDSGAEPPQQLAQKELAGSLQEAIGRLNDSEKKVITLYYFDELMLKDIADILNVTAARVSQIHSKALIKLKSAVSSTYMSAD